MTLPACQTLRGSIDFTPCAPNKSSNFSAINARHKSQKMSTFATANNRHANKH